MHLVWPDVKSKSAAVRKAEIEIIYRSLHPRGLQEASWLYSVIRMHFSRPLVRASLTCHVKIRGLAADQMWTFDLISRNARPQGKGCVYVCVSACWLVTSLDILACFLLALPRSEAASSQRSHSGRTVHGYSALNAPIVFLLAAFLLERLRSTPWHSGLECSQRSQSKRPQILNRKVGGHRYSGGGRR